MPRPTHPGVYQQEVPSGVHTITAVATAITAFVGRAQRGPCDTPVTLHGWSDFERVFGGLWAGSQLGFAVRDFFSNGGGEAWVVRLFNLGTPADAGANPCVARIDANGLCLVASSPGAWGNGLRARIEAVDPATAAALASALGVGPGDLFTLRVLDAHTGAQEVFANVTSVDSARRIDRLLQAQSVLARAQPPLATPSAHAQPEDGLDLWTDARASSGPVDEVHDGLVLDSASLLGDAAAGTGLHALDQADLFNLLCLPPCRAPDGVADQDIDRDVIRAAAAYCEQRRALLIVDPPAAWHGEAEARAGVAGLGTQSANAAVYFPRLRVANPLRDGRVEAFVPCGAVAGAIAYTDASRGVWKAPAGLDATLRGTVGPDLPLTDEDNGLLNGSGINCLRKFPTTGTVVWGARTLQGDDRYGSEWAYIPVRRTALFIEESVRRGTRWTQVLPNDDALWSQVRRNVGTFMHALHRAGAFEGGTPRDAWYVACDGTTTLPHDVAAGRVNLLIGFAR